MPLRIKNRDKKNKLKAYEDTERIEEMDTYCDEANRMNSSSIAIISIAASNGNYLIVRTIIFSYNPSEMPIKLLASQKTHSEMRSEVSEVYKQLTADLSKAHADYRSKEKRNEKDKLIHGTITDQKQSELDGAKRLFEKLFAAVSGLSEATGGEMPALEVI